jgi:hypothetical protein
MVRQAEALIVLGRTDEARAMLTQALEGRRNVFGPDHPETLAVHAHLTRL